MTPEQMAQLFIASLLAGDIETVCKWIDKLADRMRELERSVCSMEARVVNLSNRDRNRNTGTRADLFRQCGKPRR